MKRTIALKIDVTKIAKDRLYKGTKGTYLDAVLHFNDVQDQYGNNGMIVQSVSKEERQSGTRGAILGNGKQLWVESGQPDKYPNAEPATVVEDDTALPF